MSCERIQNLLPDYWTDTIPAESRLEVERHFEQCAKCRAEAAMLGRLWADLDRIPTIEAGQAVRDRFYDMLDVYRTGAEERPRWASWSWLPWAVPLGALALLVIGFYAGRAASPQTAPSPEIAQLRGEIDAMRGVSYVYGLDKSADNVVVALLDTIRTDPSVNVRLAAVDAFRKLGTSVAARKGLIEALKQQDSPLVQIAIIELLVDLNDRTTVRNLQGLALDPSIAKEVQERARWAAGQLH